MKQSIRTLAAVLTLTTLLLSACGAVNAPANIAAAKVHASEIAFTGVIEAINGNQWTINGQIVTVDPSVASDGTFTVGNTVKVKGVTAEDGSINVTSIEVSNDDGSVDDQNLDENQSEIDENQNEIDENQSEIDENQDEIQSNDQNQDENQSAIDKNNSDDGSAGDSSQIEESDNNSGLDNGSGSGGSDNGSGGGGSGDD